MADNLLVVHGGGPTAVINASLYGVIREAKKNPSIGKVLGAIGRNRRNLYRTVS